jgi:CRISPR-associated endonuclease Cas1
MKLEALSLPRGEATQFARKLANAKPPRKKLTHGTGIVQDLLLLESEISNRYWERWRGFELRFKGDTPLSWLTFGTRTRYWRAGRLGEKPQQFGNRHALYPMNAMLNYSYQIAIGQMTRALTGLGLDPALGFLHSEKPGQLSLAYDAIEPMRPRIDRVVFNYAASRVFERADFVEVKEPRAHVRLSMRVAQEIAAIVLRQIPFGDYVAVVQKVAKVL